MTPRELLVSVNDRRIGVLREADDLWAFAYDPEWSAADDAFDLSPALSRSRPEHVDGASQRPVQWYFDNLLPEEALRALLAKEAALPAEDAFGLLAYFGAESAGSLILRQPDVPMQEASGLRPLPPAALSERIRQLPQASLNQGAAKRMSLAGAQHKMVVVVRDGELFEPLPGTPSTHILKPNHPAAEYPASVINEFFTMRLAHRMGLAVPSVALRYVPEPVYIVERFDRDAGILPKRHHIIDACQLLNKARSFKYTAATLDTLAAIVAQCRARAATRLRLFRWLLFNTLVGNGDNHLKNLSFHVTPTGINLAPAYDLLSTAAYTTRAYAHERASWPQVELVLAIGEKRFFCDLDRQSFVEAGFGLGLTRQTAAREIQRMAGTVLQQARALAASLESELDGAVAASPDPKVAARFAAADRQLLRVLNHIVIPDIATRFA